MSSQWKIGERTFTSRLLVGTAKYPTPEIMAQAIEASGAEIVTVAIRRMEPGKPEHSYVYEYIKAHNLTIMPNTAGCYTVKDAVLTAQLGREALETDLVKLEVIGDEKTLFPDNEGLLEAAKILVAEGFTVMPYCIDDPIVCRKLEDLGCAAVMPLAAPIGSGLGVRNPYNLRIIVEHAHIPVLLDAGVGTASDATFAMELGVDALLMQTAIAQAQDPVKMATAMRLGTEAGRLALEAGRIPKKLYATASSPMSDLISVGR
ncbi:MAG TPA: thiazole synthase [Armatimonadota bacterium]|jgi:thiazole synthase